MMYRGRPPAIANLPVPPVNPVELDRLRGKLDEQCGILSAVRQRLQLTEEELAGQRVINARLSSSSLLEIAARRQKQLEKTQTAFSRLLQSSREQTSAAERLNVEHAALKQKIEQLSQKNAQLQKTIDTQEAKIAQQAAQLATEKSNSKRLEEEQVQFKLTIATLTSSQSEREAKLLAQLSQLQEQLSIKTKLSQEQEQKILASEETIRKLEEADGAKQEKIYRLTEILALSQSELTSANSELEELRRQYNEEYLALSEFNLLDWGEESPTTEELGRAPEHKPEGDSADNDFCVVDRPSSPPPSLRTKGKDPS
jgi:hypothetical protein